MILLSILVLLIFTNTKVFSAQNKYVSTSAIVSYNAIPDRVSIEALADAYSNQVDLANEKVKEIIKTLKENLKSVQDLIMIVDYGFTKAIYNKKYPDTERELLGYRSYHKITILFNNPNLIKNVTSKIYSSGIQKILVLSIGLSQKKYRHAIQQCRIYSSKILRKKAINLARIMGYQVAGITSLSEYEHQSSQSILSHYKLLNRGDYSPAYQINTGYGKYSDLVLKEGSESTTDKLIPVTLTLSGSFEVR